MVRRLTLALICACSCWMAGCDLISKQQPSAANLSLQAPARPAGPTSQELDGDVIEVTAAFLQRPPGDDFLSRDLWNIDQQIVDSERRILLEENGFRMGGIVGMMPAELDTLLASKAACVNHYQRRQTCGQQETYHLGPEVKRGVFHIKTGGETEQIALDQAQFSLSMIATLTRDGRTRLDFTPMVEHRRSAFPIGAAADMSALTEQIDKPHRSFPQFAWHVVLAPGQTLVMGANLEKPGTLGYESFVQDDVAEPLQRVQRVFILCTNRPAER